LIGSAPLRTGWQILKDSWNGFWDDDGPMMAGNLAYLSLIAVFPFFIFMIWLAGRFGRSDEGVRAINSFLATIPADVAAALRGPIAEVTLHRPQELLTIGVIIAIWSAGSVVETVRVIIHKAYNVPAGRPFWQYRLQSFTMVIGSALLVLIAISIQFLLAGLDQLLAAHLPRLRETLQSLDLARRLITPLLLYGALLVLLRALTPRRIEPVWHWPGALFTALLWIGIAAALPQVLSRISNYSLTYGSLGGVMVTLLFFYLVGAVFVAGAQLNNAVRCARLDLAKVRA
jgi:membrane protein